MPQEGNKIKEGLIILLLLIEIAHYQQLRKPTVSNNFTNVSKISINEVNANKHVHYNFYLFPNIAPGIVFVLALILIVLRIFKNGIIEKLKNTRKDYKQTTASSAKTSAAKPSQQTKNSFHGKLLVIKQSLEKRDLPAARKYYGQLVTSSRKPTTKSSLQQEEFQMACAIARNFHKENQTQRSLGVLDLFINHYKVYHGKQMIENFDQMTAITCKFTKDAAIRNKLQPISPRLMKTLKGLISLSKKSNLAKHLTKHLPHVVKDLSYYLGLCQFFSQCYADVSANITATIGHIKEETEVVGKSKLLLGYSYHCLENYPQAVHWYWSSKITFRNVNVESNIFDDLEKVINSARKKKILKVNQRIITVLCLL
ncbi:uncharacterized protein LOC143452295 [Clavelina lepadiformis]|uniref:uncharacterized protein LOC143452295 n=1 Tax=Clavelina lepadiformis TaxID=159417 RepID=UPI004040F624